MSGTATRTAVAVSSLVTDDGVLVRLGGTLDAGSRPELRASLLRTRPAGRADVIIDAGDVVAVDDHVLAVLLAVGAWARETGTRLSFSRMSDPLRREVDALGCAALLPMLEPAGRRHGEIAAMTGPRLATAR